ncbi:MAG TPA: glycosyltransferase family 39 protein [Planctomycetota bacterium]|nr:glycosyltransferase family 39 protein [Planctomycetota bacterium]
MKWALLLTLLLAAVLRVAALDFGLDRHDPSRAILHHQQDEEGMTDAVWRGLLHGDWNPGPFMLWGSAGYYLFGLADAAVFWPRSWFHPGGWQGVLDDLERNPCDLHLVQRGVSVLASLAMLVVVWRMARRLLGERGGLIAAVLLAVCYLAVREAHFGTLDTLVALWIVLAVDACLSLAEAPSRRHAIAAGVWTGLAAATKYSGGVVALCVAAAVIAAARRPPGGARPPLARVVREWLLPAALAAAAAFVAFSPQVVFAFDQLREALSFQQQTIGVRPEQDSLWTLAWHHLRHSFGAGLGEVALPLAAVGAVLAWRRGGQARMLVICLLLLLPMFVVARSKAVRYGIAHVALLSVLAALAIETLAGRGSALGAAGVSGAAAAARRVRPALLAALLLLAAGPSLVRSVCFDRALGGRDTRLDVIDYLRGRGLPPEEVVAVGNYGLPRPSLLGARKHLAGPPLYTDYLFRVHLARPEARLSQEEGRTLRPRLLLRDPTLEIFDVFGWDDFAATAAREYRVDFQIDARVDPAAAPLPDLVAGTPAFLLPFDNPWAMSRPGPPITIFERIAP